MFSTKFILIVSLSLVLVVSSVISLKCIQCTQHLEQYVDLKNQSMANENKCANKTDGGTECSAGEVCSFIFDSVKKTLERTCSKANVCDDIKEPSVCKTCKTDLCGGASSLSKLNLFMVPLIVGVVFSTQTIFN